MPAPQVEDTRADRAENHFVASPSTFSRYKSHQSLMSVWPPRYRQDGETLSWHVAGGECACYSPLDLE